MAQRDRDVKDYIKTRTRNFTGREWVFEEVERWLKDPGASRFFIITGEPGIGKSAIAARMVQFSDGEFEPPAGCSHLGSGFLSAAHFCYARNGGWISPVRFARSLSSQLAMLYPEFAKVLASNLNINVNQSIDVNLGTAIGVQIQNYHAESPEAVFDDLVRQPLKALSKKKSLAGELVILVDGLDEALSHSGPISIVRLLAACDDLPPQVRLLLTSRRKEDVLRPFRPLKPFILYAHSEKNKRDLQSYLRCRFEESKFLSEMEGDGSQAEVVIESLASRSRGNFLVVSKVIDSIERGELKISDTESLPADLKDLYAWFLDRRVQGDRSLWRDLYRPVLGVLAVAFEPADISTLSRWTGFGSQKVRDALHDMEEFLDPTLDGMYRLYHESVVDFLTSDHDHFYNLDTSEYHRMIIASYMEAFGRRSNWSDSDLYGLRYLPSHLAKAGCWDDLVFTLTDFNFLEVKCESLSVYDLESDYREALRCWNGNERDKQVLTAFEKRLRLESQHINRSPELLFPQLYNHLTWLAGDFADPIRIICEEAASKRSGWLRMIQNPKLSPPWLQSLEGDTGWVMAVAVTPDGSRIVSGLDDGTVKVWDVESGQLITSLGDHTGSVRSVAVTSDDARVVSGSDDGTVKVWDTESGQLITSLGGHMGSVRSVAVTPDNARIVSGSDDGTIKVWDAESGQLIRSLEGHDDSVRSVAVTPDGSHIISGSYDRTVKVWDAGSGRLKRLLRGHMGSVRSIVVTPDSSRIVSGSDDNTVKVWDTESGQLIRSLGSHTGWVRTIAITPDGAHIVSGSGDSTIKVWDAESGQLIRSLEGHMGSVMAVAVTPDGSRIVSGSDDNTVKVWDAKSSRLIRSLEGHTDSVRSVAFAPDGSHIVSGSGDDTINIWDAGSGRLIRSLEGHTGSVRSVAFTPDGARVVSGSTDTTVKIWDAELGRQIQSLEGLGGSVLAVAVTPDGSCIVSGSNDGTIKVWDGESGQLIRSLGSHKGVLAIAVTPDGSRIVSGSAWGTIKVWDAKSGRLIRSLEGHMYPVNAVAVTPDSSCIVSGSDDGTVKVWDGESGQLIKSLGSHRGWVMAVAVTSDGSRIVSGSYDRTVKIWEIESGSSIELFGHDDPIFCLVLSQDDRWLACGDSKGRTWIFEWVVR